MRIIITLLLCLFLTAAVTPGIPSGWIPVISAAQSTTVTTIKGSPATLGGYYIYNPNAAVCYLQIFDIAGTVTLGSSTPLMSLGIPTTSAANLSEAGGVSFSNAIKIAATTTATGSSACSTGMEVTVWYK